MALLVALAVGVVPAGASASVARETVSTVVNTTATSSVTIDRPFATTAGDVLVACLALNGGTVLSGGAPPGWTPIAAVTGIANPRVYGYYKVAGALEPAGYTWALASSVANGGGIARYSGVDTTTPLDATTRTATGAAATTGTVPAVTTATPGAMVTGCMGINSSSTAVTIASPSGMSQAWDVGGKRHELADVVQAAAGSSGAAAWGFSAAREWAGWLTALRPSTAPPPSPPSAPAALTATAGDAQVALSWPASAGATSYRVFRSTDGGATFSSTPVGTPAQTSFTDTGLTNGTAYTYRVTAVNAAGESGPSPTATATPRAPLTPPTGLAASAGDGKVTLTWSPGAGTGLSGYRVYRRHASDPAFPATPLATVNGAATTTYTDTTVTNGDAYVYRLTSTDGTRESAPGGEVSATPSAPPSGADPVIAAAGDIACDPADPNFRGGAGTSSSCHQKNTSDLLVNQGLAAVLAVGDIQYDCASANDLAQSWGPSWGRVNSIVRPALGNHEYYHDRNGTGIDSYGERDCAAPGTTELLNYFNGQLSPFGPSATDPARGYYSFDVGAWHLIALNTSIGCSPVSCSASSAQVSWLKADLAAHPATCTLAFFHYPLFTSKVRQPVVKPLWDALYAGGADVVLSGHVHNYERFAPQTPGGALDTAKGLREFVVGTGGKSQEGNGNPAPNSEVRNSGYGVLKLTLHASSYEWRFVSEAGKTFADTGSTACHA